MNARSSWLTSTGQTREDTRLTQLGATLPADPLRVQSGILPGSADGTAKVAGFWLKNATGLSATVDPGRAVIQGAATQGAYPVTLSDVTPVLLAPGDPQYDRIDLICLRVYDADYDDPSGNPTAAVLEVVQGDPNPSPQAPPTPDLALPLYTVTVPANASAGNGGANWTAAADLRTTTVATGGVLPVFGNSAVPGSYVGQLRDVGDVLQRWSGSAWVPYPQGIGGIASQGTATGSYVGQYRDNAGGHLQRWNGTFWSEILPAMIYYGEANTGGTTTSTAYTSTLTGADPISVTFTVASSGAVLFTLGARIQVTGTATNAWMTVGLTQGTTVISAPSDGLALAGSGSSLNSLSYIYRNYGLTPGATYTATLYYRANAAGATCSFHNRYIRVDPMK